MDKQIADLTRKLRRARLATTQVQQTTLTHIETRIDDLTNKLSTYQAVGLRWAMCGLFMTAGGVVLSFGT